MSWVLPKNVVDFLLVFDRSEDQSRRVRALKWLMQVALRQNNNTTVTFIKTSKALTSLHGQQAELALSVASIEHNLQSLLAQFRQQQEDQMALERRMMEMKCGTDPFSLSSDSLLFVEEHNDPTMQSIHASNITAAKPLVAHRTMNYW